MKNHCRDLLRWFACLCLLAAPLITHSATSKPNIIYILADDLGWAELGAYGNTFNETPNLDRMAREGMRFTRAYAAAPVCSPTRASFMTGLWPARVGITDYLRPDDANHLSTKYLTVAQLLKLAGYATGIVGKWHLTGYATHGAKEVPPTAHGFDEVMISENRGIAGGSYFHPYHFNREIQQQLPEREYLVDRCNLEAAEFIERHKNGPFFLYLSHYAVHTTLAGKPELVAKYEAKPGAGKGNRARQNNPHLAAQLESIDDGVGMILKKLRDLDLLPNTLVIFTSDNGGEDRVTHNGPLRAGKSTLYEGGFREPLIVRWPGVTPAGAVCNTAVCSVDFLPTFAAITGIKTDPAQSPDGVSLLPLFKNPQAPFAPRALYWHYPLDKPHFLGGRSGGAVLDGDWKLIEFFDTGERELYNLADDVGESHNLAAAQPDKTKALGEALKAWQTRVGAKVPAPIPLVLLKLAGKDLLFRQLGTTRATAVSPTARRFSGSGDYLDLPRASAPSVQSQPIEVSARIIAEGPDGVVLAHGGPRTGYALYMKEGHPTWSVCVESRRSTLTGPDRLMGTPVTITGHLGAGGELTLSVDGRVVARGKAKGPLPSEPGDSIQIGADTIQPVGDYKPDNCFKGVIDDVTLRIGK